MMVYSVLLSFIATAFLEFWKRRSSSLTLQWGTNENEETEVERPDFKGEEKQGVFIGKIWLDYNETILPTCKAMQGHESAPQWNPSESILPPSNKFYDLEKTKAVRVFSYVLLIVMITCVLIVNFGVLSLRLYLQTLLPKKYSIVGSIVGAICNKITIGIMGKFWKKVAKVAFLPFLSNEKMLTSWENHRTESDYIKNFTVKAFIFEFANTFSTLYYLAFFKNGTALFGDGKLQDRCSGWGSGIYENVISKLQYITPFLIM